MSQPLEIGRRRARHRRRRPAAAAASPRVPGWPRRSAARSSLRASVARSAQQEARGHPSKVCKWFEDPSSLAARPVHRRVRRADRRRGRRRQGAVEAALRGRQARRHRQQGAARQHGTELARLAEKNSVALNFEAAVAGGIPVIKTLREALAANQIRRVYGILNGTCNYILTQDAGGAPLLRRRAEGGAGARATPKPTPPSTSAASTPRTSWRC